MEGLGRNIGRDETVVGGTWGLEMGFRMKRRVVVVFFSITQARGVWRRRREYLV